MLIFGAKILMSLLENNSSSLRSHFSFFFQIVLLLVFCFKSLKLAYFSFQKPVWTSWNIFWGKHIKYVVVEQGISTPQNWILVDEEDDVNCVLLKNHVDQKILWLWSKNTLDLFGLMSMEWFVKICLDRRLKLPVILVRTIRYKACKLSLLPHCKFIFFTSCL